jgi:hypothetical protein
MGGAIAGGSAADERGLSGKGGVEGENKDALARERGRRKEPWGHTGCLVAGLIRNDQFAIAVLDVEELTLDDMVGPQDVRIVVLRRERINAKMVGGDLGDTEEVVGAFADVQVINEATLEVRGGPGGGLGFWFVD